jgi:hypothetical protein
MNADEVVMLSLDPEDLDIDFDTDLDVTPWDAAGGSFVGTLPQGGKDELARALADVESACAAFDSVDPSACAAELALRKQVGWLAMLAHAIRRVRDLVARDELCEAYLSGVELWTLDVADALAELARELNALEPRWSAFRERVASSGWIFERAMDEQARLARVADTLLPEDARAALDELAESLATFRGRLDEPLG